MEMTLNELKSAVDTALQYERHPENVDVVITTKLPYATCGQLPCTGVKWKPAEAAPATSNGMRQP